MSDFEFLSPDDKPALLAVNSADLKAQAEAILMGLGYKVHSIATHDEFLSKFQQANYEILIIELPFAGSTGVQDNETLKTIQGMSMNARRHCTVFLIGEPFQSLHPMEAFQQSVHAVVNPNELADFESILQKVIGENELFLKAFKDVQMQMAKGEL